MARNLIQSQIDFVHENLPGEKPRPGRAGRAHSAREFRVLDELGHPAGKLLGIRLLKKALHTVLHALTRAAAVDADYWFTESHGLYRDDTPVLIEGREQHAIAIPIVSRKFGVARVDVELHPGNIGGFSAEMLVISFALAIHHTGNHKAEIGECGRLCAKQAKRFHGQFEVLGPHDASRYKEKPVEHGPGRIRFQADAGIEDLLRLRPAEVAVAGPVRGFAADKKYSSITPPGGSVDGAENPGTTSDGEARGHSLACQPALTVRVVEYDPQRSQADVDRGDRTIPQHGEIAEPLAYDHKRVVILKRKALPEDIPRGAKNLTDRTFYRNSGKLHNVPFPELGKSVRRIEVVGEQRPLVPAPPGELEAAPAPRHW